jgi:hypothetical protein
MNNQPPQLASDDDILRHLGITAASFDFRTLCIEGWRAYVGAWRQPAQLLSPKEVYARWKTRAANANAGVATLARLALVQLLRPISAASCERIFSFLTHMDSADRIAMNSDTLQRTLFLRGNWRLLHQMVEIDYSAGVTMRTNAERERAAAAAAEAERKIAEDADAAAEEEADADAAEEAAVADAASDD